MSDKVYFEIIFSGNFISVLNFMNEKEWEYLAKRVDKNKIYLEATSEVYEEISFFKGSALDENFNKIDDLKIISIEEYNNTEEYKEEPKKTETPINTPLTNIDDKYEDEPNEEEKEEQINYTQINDKLSEILNNAILPSKSPLQSDDPMNYLISKDFLIQFITFSSLLLTFLSLFN